MNSLKSVAIILKAVFIFVAIIGCGTKDSSKKEEQLPKTKQLTAKEILGNPEYLAISYGGYRKDSRDIQPTLDELKEDMIILNAMGIRILRTYNVQLDHAGNVLKAIHELREEDPQFEMYVMLGAWIDCKNAWTDLEPDHSVESEQNAGEISRAVALTNQYPEIVKILAVGNEAMVKWAANYYVQPDVILKWVNHLQNLKETGKLPSNLWITSSDDFSSWGGGDPEYHTEELENLIKAVDYISMHTYPYHNSHYNPDFWTVPQSEEQLSDREKIDAAMLRAREFAISQYNAVSEYVTSLGLEKPIHIGETGWATVSNGYYGPKGSKATDEYKQAKYYYQIRDWTNANNISCFYFEAFDEPWKDSRNKMGSENHFGLFTVDGKAKYVLWDKVDNGMFKDLTRNGNPITKTYSGNKNTMMKDVLVPPSKKQTAITE